MCLARRDKTEEALAALAELRRDPTSKAAIDALGSYLTARSPHVVHQAASIAAEHEISPLVPELVAAFERLMVDAAKSDPNCAAKTAVVDALYRIGADEGSVFLRGLHHVQLEPVWGGRADTAGPLRSVSAFGLVRMNHPDAMAEVAELLADPEARVRAEAARALGYSENDLAAPALRLKALIGDEEDEVVAECYAALLKVSPDASLDFVARFLEQGSEERRKLAAVAIGSSRLPAALGCLRRWWESTASPSLRPAALLSIALLRHDRAIDFLLELIAAADGPNARDAIAALALYRHDERLVERARESMRRSAVDLKLAFEKEFQVRA